MATTEALAPYSLPQEFLDQISPEDFDWCRRCGAHLLFDYHDQALPALLAQAAPPAAGSPRTAPGRAPYFYEESNWVDDMELGAAA